MDEKNLWFLAERYMSYWFKKYTKLKNCQLLLKIYQIIKIYNFTKFLNELSFYLF